MVKPRLWIALALWFLTVNAALAAQGAGQLANITIAYTSVSPQYAPVWIAKEAGFFRRNGVNAQLVYMRGGVLATQALVSNDVNFINAGGGGVVDAVLGGADIFMIASPINQEPQVLVAKKEIKDILDWSKRADARKASPAQFMQTRFIEKLDKQGFIDGLYRR
ncbi:MAG: ABC transporter substrate-binding protein [Candidatus Binatia bacterium]